MTLAKRILIILLSSTITACGYQLSGSGESQTRLLAPAFKRVSLESLGQYDSLRHVLVPLLRAYGMRVMEPDFAQARIVFSDKQIQENVVAIGDDAKAREYLLTVNIVFRITLEDRLKQLTFPQKSIQESAPYLYSPDQLLSSQNERKKALAEVEERLAQKIVNHLISVSSQVRH